VYDSLGFRVRDLGLVLGFRLPHQVEKENIERGGLGLCWGLGKFRSV